MVIRGVSVMVVRGVRVMVVRGVGVMASRGVRVNDDGDVAGAGNYCDCVAVVGGGDCGPNQSLTPTLNGWPKVCSGARDTLQRSETREHTHTHTHARTHTRTNERTNERTNKRTNGRTKRRTDDHAHHFRGYLPEVLP